MFFRSISDVARYWHKNHRPNREALAFDLKDKDGNTVFISPLEFSPLGELRSTSPAGASDFSLFAEDLFEEGYHWELVNG